MSAPDDTITVPRAELERWRELIHAGVGAYVKPKIDALLNPPPPKRDWGVDLWGACSRHAEGYVTQRAADFAIGWLRSRGVVFPDDRGTNRGGLAPLGESTAAPQAAAPVGLELERMLTGLFWWFTTESVEAMVERWRATAPWSISSAELNGALMFERWRRENQR